MRKLLSAFLPLLLLFPVAGCAHRRAVLTPASVGYAYDDCEFEGDCYGGLDTTAASCVFVQPPAAPARLAVIVASQRHATRVVTREDWTPATASTNASASAPPPSSVAPAPVAREPVVLASPAGGGRSPRTP